MLLQLTSATLFSIVALVGSAGSSTRTSIQHTILESSIDKINSGELAPPKDLTDLIINSFDLPQKAAIQDCLEARPKRREVSTLLRSVLLKPNPHVDLFFVRPAAGVDCPAFIGPHRYLIYIAERDVQSRRLRLVHQDGVDGLTIYQSQHHGLYDLETRDCTGAGCQLDTWWFNGSAYRRVKCADGQYRKGRLVSRRSVNCQREIPASLLP